MTDVPRFGSMQHPQPMVHLDPNFDFQGFVPGAPLFDPTESSSSGATSAGDGQFTFPVRHPSQSDMTGSPTSSYAPSISDGRNNSIPYAQQTPFSMPTSGVQDRQASSSNIMASAGYQKGMALPDMSASHWTPNFSFGSPSQQQSFNTMPQRYPEPYTISSHVAKGPYPNPTQRRGSHGFTIPQEFPSNYPYDRRMSHPVLPSGSIQTSPNMPRPRQVSAVDWRSYATQGNMMRAGQGDVNHGFQEPEAFWGTINTTRGTAAISPPNANSSADLYRQSISSRRPSVPFLPGSTIDEDGAPVDSSLFHSSTHVRLGSSEGSIVMQPTLGSDGKPDQASMMNTFSAKDTNSGHKKHVCPVCKKRFTRPSSLTTHVYSHTGEKPFICEVEGCGRHFSVISNLRRHKKIHSQSSQDAAAAVAS